MKQEGKRQIGRRFSGIFRFIVVILAIALSFSYNIFGATDVVMAIGCSSNASTEAACEVLEAKGKAENCADRSGNVGAMWLSETSDGDSETITPSQTSGNITAYLRGAFVADGCNGGGPFYANRIRIQYGYGKRQSKGTEIPYITGEGGKELDRGTSAGGYGDWSEPNDSIAVTINLDRLRNDTDHVSFSDGVYVLKGSIYRCPVGVDENSDNCWGDPFRIKIKIPTKYRYRTYRYYKDYTISDTTKQTSSDGVRTVTNTQYYKGSSTTTATSTGNRDPEAGASKTSNGNGKTGAVTNRTATLTLYNRERQTANVGFVENITKLSNDDFALVLS